MMITKRRFNIAGFVFAMLLFGFIGFAAYRDISHLMDAEDWVAHTYIVLEKLTGLEALPEKAHAARRGYVLTGEKEFLNDLNSAMQEIQPRIAELQKLTSDNPVQQRRILLLRGLLNDRAGIWKESIEVPISDRRTHEEIVRSSRAMMDHLHTVIDAIRAEELRLLQARRSAIRQDTRNTIFALLGSGALSILILFTIFFFLNKEIAERKKTEEVLDRFFTLTLEMFCMTDFQGRFRKLNPAWQRTLGYTEEEFLRTPFIEFVHPEDRERTLSEFSRILDGQAVLSFENRYRHKDGSYRWLLWSAVPAVETQTVYAAARDITERKKSESVIAELNGQLEGNITELVGVNQELEAFSYSVSHDLRAPLRHVTGFSQLLRKQSASVLDEKGLHYLDAIHDSARKMGVLIDDLLTFSRVGRTELRKEPVLVQQLVREVIDEMRNDTAGRNIDWQVELLPTVYADVALLRLVLMNLISNAVKYTKYKSHARIQIGCARSDQKETVLYVRDNGVGFNKKYIDKLFGVFQRLHSSAEFEGTGIGLANVRRIVHRHDGEAWGEGEVDQGATFYFSLPGKRDQPKSAA